MKLNPEQNEAVEHGEGPMLILAGAGSGKTRVIVQRIVNLLHKKAATARQVCAVTFTNKSAGEMKERLKEQLGKKQKGMFVGTFHALGLKIIRDHPAECDLSPKFTILASEDQLSIYNDLIKECGLDPDEVKDKQLAWLVSQAKNQGGSDQKIAAYLADNDGDVFAEVFNRYQEKLTSYNSVDFDDLILKPTRLLQNHPEIQTNYRQLWKYFLVDEFQDTNPLQFDFLTCLLSEPFNLCAVGDDDQSIYGWRGADIQIILNFKKLFTDPKIIYLEQNYRSNQHILDLANSVIRNNSERHAKKLWSEKKSGSTSPIYEAETSVEEASYICDQINKLRKFTHASEIALLYRTNFQSRAFEEALRLNGIPYHISGAYQFYDRKEIKDILAYLRFIANQHDEKSLLRIINFPKRNIGDKTVQNLRSFSHEHKLSIWQVIKEIESAAVQIAPAALSGLLEFRDLIEKYTSEIGRNFAPACEAMIKALDFEKAFYRQGLEEKIIKAKTQNISELVRSLYEFANREENVNIYSYLQFIALVSGDDRDENENQEKVNLMTLHNSKGLEFEAVFLAGLAEGMLPHRKSIEELDNVEEERRLFYVGITRAKAHVYFSYPKMHRTFDGEVINEPSRFLSELPQDMVKWYLLGSDDEESFEDALESLSAL